MLFFLTLLVYTVPHIMVFGAVKEILLQSIHSWLTILLSCFYYYIVNKNIMFLFFNCLLVLLLFIDYCTYIPFQK